MILIKVQNRISTKVAKIKDQPVNLVGARHGVKSTQDYMYLEFVTHVHMQKMQVFHPYWYLVLIC